MKKTLFALLACATLAAPAMAVNWIFAFGVADKYNNDITLSNYSFYMIVRENTTASVVSSAIQEQTLSEFLADAGQRYEFNDDTGLYTVQCAFWSESDLSRDIDASDIWGISVYQNGDNALFQVRAPNDIFLEETLLAYTDADISYTAFKSESPATPEPATATLSLLALAGMASRRRRK